MAAAGSGLFFYNFSLILDLNSLNSPESMTISYISGNAVLYVSDTSNNRILKFPSIGSDFTGIVIAGYGSCTGGSGYNRITKFLFL